MDQANGTNQFGTLYDLCEAVAHAIETKPGNYYQQSWRVPCEALKYHNAPQYKEACGTAYCRAGWMVALTSPDSHFSRIEMTATHMLTRAGIPREFIRELFRGGAAGDTVNKDYVQRGAQGMRDFMQRWETELKSITVEDALN